MDNTFKTVGTWERYKLGQAQFTDWLKQAADKVRPKNDGNANSHAADARVRLSEMEELAKVVVDGYKPEEIPYTPIVVLRGVVDLRKQSGKFYTRLATQSDDERIKTGNKGHEYTIQVLDRVLKTLEDAVTSVKHSFNKQPDQDSIANMFELLHLSTPKDAESEEEHEEEVPTKPKKPKKPKKPRKGKKPKKAPKPATSTKKPFETTDAETDWIDRVTWFEGEEGDKNEFDYYMVIYCFFLDFNKIRDYVNELWCDYFYDKSMNHATLAVVHNAACELFFHMEKDLQAALTANGWIGRGQYNYMMDILLVRFCVGHINPDDGSLTDGQTPDKVWQQGADWVAYGAFTAMVRILKQARSAKIPCIPPSKRESPKYGASTYEEFTDFAAACSVELYTEAAQIKALKESTTKSEREPRVLPAEPDLLLDLQHVLEARYYVTSAIFSLQLFLDMRHIMEDKVSDAFGQLQHTGKRAVEQLRRHSDNCLAIRFPSSGHRDIKNINRYILGDFTFDDKEARYRVERIREAPEKFFLLKRDPVWSGLLDFRTELTLYAAGVNGLCKVLDFYRTLGLYYFLRDSIPSWPLLDQFIRIHPVKLFYDETLQGNHTLSAYVKASHPRENPTQALAIVHSIDVGQFFLSRYGDAGSAISYRTVRTMDYVEEVQRYIERPPLEKRVRDIVRQRLTMPVAPKIEKRDSKPMQHLEVLRVLGDMTDYLVNTVFKMDYIQLVQEAAMVGTLFRKELERKGVIKEQEEEWRGLCRREDGKEIVQEALSVAIRGAKLDHDVSKLD